MASYSRPIQSSSLRASADHQRKTSPMFAASTYLSRASSMRGSLARWSWASVCDKDYDWYCSYSHFEPALEKALEISELLYPWCLPRPCPRRYEGDAAQRTQIEPTRRRKRSSHLNFGVETSVVRPEKQNRARRAMSLPGRIFRTGEHSIVFRYLCRHCWPTKEIEL